MAEILLVDDDLSVRKSKRDLFEAEGYEFRDALSGAKAIEEFTKRRPDLVLLDVNMAKMNGFRVFTSLQTIDSTVPILFFTGKEADVDQLRGLDLGADDYIFKSSSDAILLARVARALARRKDQKKPLMVGPQEDEIIKLGQVTVDLRQYVIMKGDRKLARLTKNEAAILRVLNSDRGRTFSREQIVHTIHGGPYVVEPSTFRAYIAGLRSKLGPAQAMIDTVHDCGYRLVPQ